MSGLLAGKVWLSALAPHLKPLAATLADIANDDGTRIYPTVEYVAWRLGATDRTVSRQLGELLKLRVLEVVRSARHHQPTEYRLHESKLPARPRWKIPGKREDILSPLRSDQGGHKITPETGSGVISETSTGVIPETERGDLDDRSGVIPETERGDLDDKFSSASLNDPLCDPLEDPLRDTRAADAPRSLSLGPNADQRAWLRLQFDRLCAVYPRVEKKKRCWRVFFRMQPSKAVVESMLAMVEHQKRTVWGGLKPRYIPSLLTYLTDEQWTDEVSDVAPYGAEELANARRLMGSLYLGRCPHGPPCASSDDCLKAIAARQRCAQGSDP